MTRHTVYKITPESCETNSFSLLAFAMWKHESKTAGFELYLIDQDLVWLEEDYLNEYLEDNVSERFPYKPFDGITEFEEFMLDQVKECIDDCNMLECFEETLKLA